MRASFGNKGKSSTLVRTVGIVGCALLAFGAQHATAQAASAAQAAPSMQSIDSFRSAYGALMDSYDQVFLQEGDLRGQDMVARGRAAMQAAKDADLAKVFARSGAPDMMPAITAMQGLAALSQQALRSGKVLKSLPFPTSPTVIDACNNTPHGDQITYDALIAYQVTSGILAAAAWVCNEDILGENGSAACIPLAIANDVASSLFAVRSFCGGLDTSASVAGNFQRLDHIHSDLTDARSAIIDNANSNATAISNNINASMTSIINNDNSNKNDVISSIATSTSTIVSNSNANTTSILSNANANTATIVNTENTNRDIIVGELHALGCEIIRLLNTPDGKRASSILACSSQPGFPYSWNKH